MSSELHEAGQGWCSGRTSSSVRRASSSAMILAATPSTSDSTVSPFRSFRENYRVRSPAVAKCGRLIM